MEAAAVGPVVAYRELTVDPSLFFELLFSANSLKQRGIR